uniref:Platelet-derived growth factor C n=1 Tax=Callorhinchus milii TaxID=7868 RepID=A0A4W3IM67_CALMI
WFVSLYWEVPVGFNFCSLHESSSAVFFIYKCRVHDHQHENMITVSEDGFVQSPRFPQNYPRDVVLVWRLIAANENMQIQMTFDERFGLEEPENGLCKFDFVEIEDLSDGTIIGRWCGTKAVPGMQISKANQVRIRFRSDEYLASKPGFCLYYSLLEPVFSTVSTVLPPSSLSLDTLNDAVSGFDTLEELIKYLDPERWQLDLEDLYKPTWQMLGKAFMYGRKSKVDLNLLKEEVKLYSCTPRNLSVSLREELKRTDTLYWPGCLLVKRCGGNCACCSLSCLDCQCVPVKVSKKYYEVLKNSKRSDVTCCRNFKLDHINLKLCLYSRRVPDKSLVFLNMIDDHQVV